MKKQECAGAPCRSRPTSPFRLPARRKLGPGWARSKAVEPLKAGVPRSCAAAGGTEPEASLHLSAGKGT